MEYSYSLIRHIKIFNSDPICAIDLNDDILLFGTMLGYCGYFLINRKELKIISEIEDEHIVATQIKKDKLCFAVGDQKIIKVEKKDNKYKDCTIKEISNYYDEAEHIKKCDNTFCMIKDDFLFLIELNIPKEEEKSAEKRISHWIIKNYEKDKSFKGDLELSSFWVPFEFDGKLLIYIDFYENNKRYLKIFNFRDKKFILDLKLWEMENDEYLGHISHIKKLDNDKIFLVHNYKYIQIRDFKFKLIKQKEHIGNEILACDIYYNNKNEIEIALLDLSCSIYIYNEKNNCIDYLFNLHKLNSIDREIKEQKFFSLGYPYFIKKSKNYIAVTTDQGCLLLKRQ